MAAHSLLVVDHRARTRLVTRSTHGLDCVELVLWGKATDPKFGMAGPNLASCAIATKAMVAATPVAASRRTYVCGQPDLTLWLM